MKRILSVFLVLLVLMSTALPVAAAEKTLGEMILEEVSQLVDLNAYPANDKDTGIYLVSLIETGYGANGFEDGNALYLYLYNPSQKKISVSDLNKITMAYEWDDAGEKPTKFRKYGVDLEGYTADMRFVRCKVKTPAKDLAKTKGGVRKYGVSEIELYEHGNFNATACEVGYTFEFSGYGEDLKCNRKSFLTIELKVGHTSYLTSANDQISSIYFSVPKDIEKEYGKLYDITYEYYKYRTLPMLITTVPECLEVVTPLLGKISTPNDWPVSIYNTSIGSDDVVNINYLYGDVDESNWFDETFGKWKSSTNGYFSELRIALKANTLESGEEAVSSDRLEKYFEDYTKDHPLNSMSSGKLVCGFHPNLFENPFGGDHYVLEYKTRDDLFSASEYVDVTKWWEKLFGFSKIEENVYDIKYIEPLSGVDLRDAEFCDDYYFGKEDLAKLQDFSAIAEDNDENVYLLRFATSDYSYTDVSISYKKDEDQRGWNIASGALVVEDVYLQFDVIQLGFSDDGEDITTFGVVMSPINIYPSVDNSSKPNNNNDDPKVDWLRLIMLCASLIVLMMVVFRLPGMIAAFSQTSANRAMRRYYNNQNRRR